MPRIFKLLREALSLGADAEQVTGRWGGVFAVIQTLVTGSFGIATQSYFIAFVIAPFAGFAVLLAWRMAVTMRSPFNQYFDVAEWKGHPVYTIWVAACLWNNHRPWPAIPSDSPAWSTLQMIKSHLEGGQIKSLHEDTGMKARIAREELIKLANIRGGKLPEFLR
jgi:hypothetical protein